MDTTLQVKIKALVEGLQEVASLGQKFLEVAKQSEALDAAGSKFDGLGAKGKEAADTVEKAWSKLGGSSTAAITKQIEDIRAALDKVKTSGASFDEIARASQLAETKIAALNKQLQSPAPKTYADTINESFAKLGGRSTDQIKAQIQEINQALLSVKNSGAGFEEVARASQLAEARIEQLNRELKDPSPKNFGEAVGSIAGKLSNLDFKGAASEAKELLGNLGGITAALGPLAAGFIALTGIKALGALAKDAANAAAKVETMGVVLNVVGRNAGYSEESLSKASKGIEKMGITSSVARESLTQMIQSGIKINEMSTALGTAGEKLTRAQELARAAQDLAVVSGEGSSETLQRLVLNMQQMDTQGLKFMGLIVNQEAAFAKYAVTLNKTADALSPTEKRQAFMNATLDEARKLQGAYGESLETVGKKLGTLARYQEQFLVSIGQNLTPAYGALVDAATNFLKESEQIVQSMSAQSNASQNLKDGLAPVANLLSDLGQILVSLSFDVFIGASGVIKEVGGTIGTVWQAVKDLFNALVDVGATFVRVFSGGEESASRIIKALDPIQGFFNDLRLILAAVSDVISILVVAVEGVTAAFLGVFGDVLRAAGTVVGFFDKEWGAAMVKAGDGLKKASADLEASASKIINKFGDGQSALGKFADEIDRTSKVSSTATVQFVTLSGEIDALAEAQRSGGASADELAIRMAKLGAAVQKAKDEGVLAKGEYEKLGKQLTSIPNEIVKGFDEAFQSAKINLATLRNQITDDVSVGLAAFDKLLEVAKTKNKELMEAVGLDAKTVADDVLNTFTLLANKAKSLGDLSELSSRLRKAQQDGIITQEQFNDELEVTSGKFDEIFQASLKAARTERDFERLAAQVKKVGEEGGITGTRVIEALKQITTAATGLSGVYKELAEAQDKLAQLNSNLQARQAELEVVRATAKIMVDSVQVVKARYEYEKNGTELNKLNLQIAQKQVEISGLELQAARASFEEAKVSKDILIEKQRELNALKRLELNANDEVAQAEAARARENQANYDLSLTRIQQQRTEIQTTLLEREKEQVMLGAQRDQLKVLSDIEKDRQEKIRGSKAATDDHTKSVGEHAGRVKDVSDNMGVVVTNQQKITDGYLPMGVASANWSSKTIEDYLRVSNAISGVVAAQKALDQATGASLTSGKAGAGSTGTTGGYQQGQAPINPGSPSGTNNAGSKTDPFSNNTPANSSFVGGMVLETWLSIFNTLKGYSLPDQVARDIAEEFAPNGKVKYENNPAQMKYAPGGGSMSLAIRNAAQAWIRDNPEGEKAPFSLAPKNTQAGGGGYDGTGSKAGQSVFGSAAYKPSAAVVSPAAVQSIAATNTATVTPPSAQVNQKTITLLMKDDAGKEVALTTSAGNEDSLNSMLARLQAAQKRT